MSRIEKTNWLIKRWEIRKHAYKGLLNTRPNTDGFVQGNNRPFEAYRIQEAEIVVLTNDVLKEIEDGRMALKIAVEMVQAEEVYGLNDSDLLAIMYSAMNFILKSSPKFIDGALAGNDEATAVIDYLNKVTGKKFRPTASVKTMVKARLKEGYCIEEFFAVIDWQTFCWKEDRTMAKYLRPATLFIPSKFDGYLQDVPAEIRKKHGLTEGEFIVNDDQDWE